MLDLKGGKYPLTAEYEILILQHYTLYNIYATNNIVSREKSLNQIHTRLDNRNKRYKL